MKLCLSILGVLSIAAAGLLLTRSLAEGSPKPDVRADVQSDVQADVQGNAQRGAGIVASGTSYGVAACATCHALNGAASGIAGSPKLAGIPAYYLAKQLRDFASGARVDAIMSAIAGTMKPEDIADVSEYYSGVRGAPTPPPAAEPDLMALGTRLATVGDETKMVQACEGCHGPEGRGEAPAIPPLAGQYASYIALQMKMWQEGHRKNDASQQMTNIAKRLSARDIQAVGLYFERQPQPDLAK
jgi:cytochrome c553